MSNAEQTVFRSGLMPEGSVSEVQEEVRDFMGYLTRRLVGYVPDAEVAAMWSSYVFSVEELDRHGITDPEDQITLMSHYDNDPLSVPSHIRDIIEGLKQGSQREYDLRVSTAEKISSIYRKQPSEQERRAEREQQKADREFQKKREEETHMHNQKEVERHYLQTTHNLQVAERNFDTAMKQSKAIRRGAITLGVTLATIGVFLSIGSGAAILGPIITVLGGLMAMGPGPANYRTKEAKAAEDKLDDARLQSQIATQRYFSSL